MLVGELLKNARTTQNLTLSQVEKAIKIRASFLKALEEGDYFALPSSAYVRGFVKNYAEFLGLPTESILARLRRELDEKNQSLLPRGVEKEYSQPSIRISAFYLLVGFLLVSFFSYLFFQYRGFLGNPTLEVKSPTQNEIVRDTTVTVLGRTDPDSSVKINGELVEVSKNGNFQKKLTVFKGNYTLVITAKNRFGRETSITRTIVAE